MKKLLFTDLDGTLLDLETYSFKQSLGAIERLKSAGVPIIFCSSKTKSEQEFYRQALDINDPFIVENGSAIYIPKGYFSSSVPFNTFYTGDYEVIQIGNSVDNVRSTLKQLKQEMSLGFNVYEDLAVEKVSDITGLDNDAASRAMQRDYSETILEGEVHEDFYINLSAGGYRCIPGSKYKTIVDARANKGRAVSILTSLFKKKWGEIETYGVGDSTNDAEMLAETDTAYLVQKPNRSWSSLTGIEVNTISEVGPLGWKLVVEEMLN